jgi:hypothetical protein
MDTSTPATCLGHESVETHIVVVADGALEPDAQAWPSAARLDAAQPPAAVLKMAEAVLSHAR